MRPPLSIKGVQGDLKEKKYNCTELVNFYLGQAKKLNPTLNAFTTICEDFAFEKTKILNEIIQTNPKAFEEFPLMGVVLSLKDLFSTKGIRTTAGSEVLSDYIPPFSGTVVNKLEEAGAIIIGKTNCDAWGHGASGENSDFGPAKNPWDTSRVPGGSSSGSAVSVSAQMCMASMGTDTGGSIRQPAGFCNLVGLKPTYGAVSRYGVIAMASSLDTVGHLTRFAEDSEIIFNVIKGKDGKDGTIKDQYKENKALNIGIPKEYYGLGIDREIVELINAAKSKVKGVKFVEVSLPHTRYAIPTYYIIQPAEVSSNLARYDGVRYGKSRKAFGDEAVRRIMLGTYVLSGGYYDAYYLKAMKIRSKIINDFDRAFEKVDALLTPVSPTPAFKLGEKNEPLEMYMADALTAPASLAGLPAMSLPVGFSGKGLPVGMQLIGPRFSENVLFDLGKRYQEATDWHLQTPNL